eukprot:CAMPEP_0197910968 /NCGR_PEP_ID=MMETSP1439-20131203/71919_1 /TAXON_ID=66791 /ORGANISM="Gonyaulax spinifera, Strain CCMP409" /LENGTH=79 /DNA_ID=CAMNT_0043532673 /DNA_START=18 /DNA_END=254 /DNA_ORIENTATION=+
MARTGSRSPMNCECGNEWKPSPSEPYERLTDRKRLASQGGQTCPLQQLCSVPMRRRVLFLTDALKRCMIVSNGIGLMKT